MKNQTLTGRGLSTKAKLTILGGVVVLTVAIHYGWPLFAVFGHTAWEHALHSRFCYIPIVMAASWFGIDGGLFSATAITLLVIPYLFGLGPHPPDLSSELVEIFFYYGLGILVGGLIDRELKVRRQREETQLHLERSQRLSLVGQIAAGVAHEIKNPLASIKGAMEIMSDESVSQDERREFRDVMSREIKRIDTTVGDFLAFARPRDAVMKQMNLSKALEQVARQISPKISTSNMTLASKVAPEVFITGDEEKLHQAFVNLILNSVEASSSGATIDMELKTSGQEAQIMVRDYGCGIPQDHLSHIFEPFYSTKGTGSGLGLAIVKSIIDAHNGSITVSSKPDIGTSVGIVLPLSKGES